MKALIVSGLSGSGKSSVIKALEDVGFYCVDNLPVALLEPFMDISLHSEGEIQKVAFVVDARDQKNIGQLPEILKRGSVSKHSYELIFLTAKDDVLVRRFSETRRRHPLSPEGSVEDGIQAERKLLEPIQGLANQVIDSSDFTIHDLRKHIVQRFGTTAEKHALTVEIVSFGFKYGLPMNADLVLDVRFLPNPFFRDDLKAKTGLDPDVFDYVMEQKDTKPLLEEYKRLIKFLLPRFDREGKSYLVIAIGCTGGKHRSVSVARKLEEVVQKLGFKVAVKHRDVGRE